MVAAWPTLTRPGLNLEKMTLSPAA